MGKTAKWLEAFQLKRDFCKIKGIVEYACPTAEHFDYPEMLRQILSWLCLAQDNNKLCDAGVSRHYSLKSGWGSSYPETTGYIVPTMLSLSSEFPDLQLDQRAMIMTDWLVSIQLPSGGFAGSTVENAKRYPEPVVFNTGQILIGLSAAENHFPGRYEKSIQAAACWLLEVQEANGSWLKGSSPVAKGGIRAYDTHVAFGLLEAENATGEKSYGSAACSNLDFTLSLQTADGWYRDCCLTDKENPLTHTIGYTLRGILEGYERTGHERYLHSCLLTASSICETVRTKGYLPGRLNEKWDSPVDWQCLTGNSQIAYVLFRLFKITEDQVLLATGIRLLHSVIECIAVSGPEWIVGAVSGSAPVSGGYLAYQWPNWAAKFTADAIWERIKLDVQV